MPIPNEKKEYTYKDYLKWEGNERWELIDGIPYLQASPTWQHQEVLGELFVQLRNYFKDKPCKVIPAPFDICLEKTDESKQVFQPDIVVMCDSEKLKNNAYFGAPTMAIEILSPSTSRNDRILKFNKYKDFGVAEYWIVSPVEKIIETFTLNDGKYDIKTYSQEEKTIEIPLFEGLNVDISNIFPE